MNKPLITTNSVQFTQDIVDGLHYEVKVAELISEN
jgi:hypothetical protein